MSKKDVEVQEGDLVKFTFSNREGDTLTGYLYHSPCATGDAWIIDAGTANPEIIYIQQYETMEILKRKEEKDGQ